MPPRGEVMMAMIPLWSCGVWRGNPESPNAFAAQVFVCRGSLRLCASLQKRSGDHDHQAYNIATSFCQWIRKERGSTNSELIRRWLGAYLDGELELTQQLDLEAHLAACFTCKTIAEQATNFGSWLRVNMPVYKAPREFRATLQASLRRELT